MVAEVANISRVSTGASEAFRSRIVDPLGSDDLTLSRIDQDHVVAVEHSRWGGCESSNDFLCALKLEPSLSGTYYQPRILIKSHTVVPLRR